MDTAFLIVIGFQFAYIIYLDIQNRKEREMLEMKLMSRDLGDYKSLMEEVVEESQKEEESPYIPMEEASIEQVLKSKEKK